MQAYFNCIQCAFDRCTQKFSLVMVTFGGLIIQKKNWPSTWRLLVEKFTPVFLQNQMAIFTLDMLRLASNITRLYLFQLSHLVVFLLKKKILTGSENSVQLIIHQ